MILDFCQWYEKKNSQKYTTQVGYFSKIEKDFITVRGPLHQRINHLSWLIQDWSRCPNNPNNNTNVLKVAYKWPTSVQPKPGFSCHFIMEKIPHTIGNFEMWFRYW